MMKKYFLHYLSDLAALSKKFPCTLVFQGIPVEIHCPRGVKNTSSNIIDIIFMFESKYKQKSIIRQLFR